MATVQQKTPLMVQMNSLSNLVPHWIKHPLLLLRDKGNAVECPCCGWTFKTFWPSGVNPVPNSMCPKCNSLQRHRLMWLFLNSRLDLESRKLKLLHVAPEPLIQKILCKRANIDYLSADFESPLAMERMDLTDIRKADNAFDAIICIHVLEHIPNDHKAMTELFRVLKPGGWALLQCPVEWTRGQTYEDATIVSRTDRLKAFGQEDHVRIYGSDYTDRLSHAGFKVERLAYAREMGDSAISRYGLDPSDDIVLCHKV